MPDEILDNLDEYLSTEEAFVTSASRSGNSRSVSRSDIKTVIEARQMIAGQEARARTPKRAKVRFKQPDA